MSNLTTAEAERGSAAYRGLELKEGLQELGVSERLSMLGNAEGFEVLCCQPGIRWIDAWPSMVMPVTSQED